MAERALHQPSERVTVDGIEYVRAYPVADGRCAHCGQEPPIWTPDRIAESARAWAAWAGRTPTDDEWQSSRIPGEPARPVADTVWRIFGRWAVMLKFAGLKQRKSGAPKIWTRERVIDALLDWRAEHGAWPRTTDWRASTPTRPHYQLIYDVFPSWPAAIEAARGVERRPRMVAAAPLVGPVRRYLADGVGSSMLAELAGVDEATVRRLVADRKTFLMEETAEALCLAIGREDLLVAA